MLRIYLDFPPPFRYRLFFRAYLERKPAERERRTEEIETARLQRLREQHSALIELAKNEAIHGGRLDEAFHAITETAARVLGVGRASVWFFNGERSAIRLGDLFEHSRGVHSEGAILSAHHFPDYFKALEQEERAIVACDAHMHAAPPREYLAGDALA